MGASGACRFGVGTGATICGLLSCASALAATSKAGASSNPSFFISISRSPMPVFGRLLYVPIQPMRAQLGLQPAPEFQQRLVPPAQSAYAAPPPARITTARPTAPRKKAGFFDNLLNAPAFAVSRMASYRYEKNGAFVVA